VTHDVQFKTNHEDTKRGDLFFAYFVLSRI